MHRALPSFPPLRGTYCTHACLRTRRDTEKIRLDLERGLSEEFKSLRRENEVLRRETAHKDSEVLDGVAYSIQERNPSLAR